MNPVRACLLPLPAVPEDETDYQQQDDKQDRRRDAHGQIEDRKPGKAEYVHALNTVQKPYIAVQLIGDIRGINILKINVQVLPIRLNSFALSSAFACIACRSSLSVRMRRI